MPKNGGSERVYICITREEATEIMAALWYACRRTGNASRWKARDIMMDIIRIADAVDYFDQRHGVNKVDLCTVTELVAEGLETFPAEMVEYCKDS